MVKMQIFARLRKLTHVHRRWRAEGRTGGMLHGIQFRWDGFHYVTKALEPDRFEAVKDNHLVQLEMVAHTTDVAAMQSLPVEPTAPAAEEPDEAPAAEPEAPAPFRSRLPPRSDWAPPKHDFAPKRRK